MRNMHSRGSDRSDHSDRREFVIKATVGKVHPKKVVINILARNGSQAIIRFLESQQEPQVFRSITAIPIRGESREREGEMEKKWERDN